MSNQSPFKDLKEKGGVELKIGTDRIKVKPTVSDAELFMTLKKGDLDPQDIKNITQILIGMVQKANPNEDKEDIESYVAAHYGDLMLQIGVVFGFMTVEDVEEAKKKLLAKTEEKK